MTWKMERLIVCHYLTCPCFCLILCTPFLPLPLHAHPSISEIAHPLGNCPLPHCPLFLGILPWKVSVRLHWWEACRPQVGYPSEPCMPEGHPGYPSPPETQLTERPRRAPGAIEVSYTGTCCCNQMDILTCPAGNSGQIKSVCSVNSYFLQKLASWHIGINWQWDVLTAWLAPRVSTSLKISTRQQWLYSAGAPKMSKYSWNSVWLRHVLRTLDTSLSLL